ncbi:hypothetical protein D3C72_434470 [compost metagenome]
MKKISLKIKHDQLTDLGQWLTRVISEMGNGKAIETKCFCAILIKVLYEKVLPKANFWFKDGKLSLHAHEAYALAYAITWIPYDDFPYLSSWLNKAAPLIDNHNFLNK